MSRIRSIHPGIWTDEDFVTLSPMARLLFIGLWNECDDKGVFEWKPLTIKMRVLPADSLDVAALLEELASANCVCRYEIGGKSYGAVRNFGKFQRPKKPNDIHPITPEMRAFCGFSSEPANGDGHGVPNQWGTGGEIGAQMEDGGEDGEEEKAPPPPPQYKFSGKIVRLNEADYQEWRQRFHAIPDFDAELTALDGWLRGQDEAKRKKWFGSAGPWLNRKHQEALAAKRAKPAAVKVGI